MKDLKLIRLIPFTINKDQLEICPIPEPPKEYPFGFFINHIQAVILNPPEDVHIPISLP